MVRSQYNFEMPATRRIRSNRTLSELLEDLENPVTRLYSETAGLCYPFFQYFHLPWIPLKQRRI